MKGEIVRCIQCGNDNAEDFKFCNSCGAPLVPQVDLKDRALRQPILEIRKAVSERNATDFRLTPYFVLVPALIGIVGSAIGIGVMFSDMFDYVVEHPSASPTDAELLEMADPGIYVFSVAHILAQAIFVMLAYVLVSRQRRHFERERRLRDAVISLIKSSVKTAEGRERIMGETHALDSENEHVEKRRQPLFWAFAVGIILISDLVALQLIVSRDYGVMESGVYTALSYIASFSCLALTFYMFYFLGNDMYQHDTRWNEFSYNARVALTKLGYPPGPPFSRNGLPSQNFWLYLFLSIISIGLFAIYWGYRLIDEPNDHFNNQWEFEDNLVEVLRAAG